MGGFLLSFAVVFIISLFYYCPLVPPLDFWRGMDGVRDGQW